MKDNIVKNIGWIWLATKTCFKENKYLSIIINHFTSKISSKNMKDKLLYTNNISLKEGKNYN